MAFFRWKVTPSHGSLSNGIISRVGCAVGPPREVWEGRKSSEGGRGSPRPPHPLDLRGSPGGTPPQKLTPFFRLNALIIPKKVGSAKIRRKNLTNSSFYDGVSQFFSVFFYPKILRGTPLPPTPPSFPGFWGDFFG